MRNAISILIWIAAVGCLIYGAFFSWQYVLDKPLSVDAAHEGVKVVAMTEFDLTNAVSTDEVDLNEDDQLQKRPSVGFCAT